MRRRRKVGRSPDRGIDRRVRRPQGDLPRRGEARSNQVADDLVVGTGQEDAVAVRGVDAPLEHGAAKAGKLGSLALAHAVAAPEQRPRIRRSGRTCGVQGSAARRQARGPPASARRPRVTGLPCPRTLLKAFRVAFELRHHERRLQQDRDAGGVAALGLVGSGERKGRGGRRGRSRGDDRRRELEDRLGDGLLVGELAGGLRPGRWPSEARRSTASTSVAMKASLAGGAGRPCRRVGARRPRRAGSPGHCVASPVPVGVLTIPLPPQAIQFARSGGNARPEGHDEGGDRRRGLRRDDACIEELGAVGGAQREVSEAPARCCVAGRRCRHRPSR